MGEKFTGFHRILFDDTSFYKAEVSPLAREFVNNKKRNICIIVHGAHGTGRRRALFGDQRKNEVLDNNYISSSLNELCANPYRRRQESDDHDDSVSSIGSRAFQRSKISKTGWIYRFVQRFRSFLRKFLSQWSRRLVSVRKREVLTIMVLIH